MRIFKNMMLAICLGIFGGLAVTVLSYYNSHKQEGVFNTMLAVANSADTIKQAYSGALGDSYKWNVDKDMIAGGRLSSPTGEYIDDRIPALADSVLAAFNDMGIESEDIDITKVISDVLLQTNEDKDIISVNDDINLQKPYGDIMRFHVRANSDSPEDQELKLAVRDDVMAMLKPVLSDSRNVAESKKEIINNLQNIYTTAVDTITEQGYDYPVKVYVTVEEFPAKAYGDITFPAGKYQALRIDIGNAAGQNWWCVMYPPLCFIDETTAVVSDEGKKLLKDNLTDEEYKALFADKNTEIKGESIIYNKIREWIAR